MKEVVLDQFDILKTSTIPMVQFHSHSFDESYQYDSTNAMHLHILLRFILTKGMIYPLLTTISNHTDGCTNLYHC